MSDRTFRITQPHMRGPDVELGQRDLRAKLDHWGAREYPLPIDGDYGVATRAAYALVCKGMGIAQADLEHGITPRIRSKIRNAELTATERSRYEERADWRKALADKWAHGGTAAPLAKIITHANGFTAGHDGVDLICPPQSPAFAIIRSRVVRISDDWWGAGAPRDPAVRDKGDGIVIMRALVAAGPIEVGDYLGYGHGEHPRVHVGQTVEPGTHVCDAGMANAWHLHFMQFRGDPGKARDGGPKGIGNRDPWPAVRYCIEHA